MKTDFCLAPNELCVTGNASPPQLRTRPYGAPHFEGALYIQVVVNVNSFEPEVCMVPSVFS